MAKRELIPMQDLQGHLIDLSIEVGKLKLGLSAIARVANDACQGDLDDCSEGLFEVEALAKVLAELAAATETAIMPASIVKWLDQSEAGHE